MAGRWRMEDSEEALEGAQQVEDLLDLPLLQRLAQQRAQEIRILESDDTFEFIQVCLHMRSTSRKDDLLLGPGSPQASMCTSVLTAACRLGKDSLQHMLER